MTMPNKKIMREEITGLILAGGRASRMNGDDKGLLKFRGTPLIQHVKQRLAPQVGPLLINANRHLHDYALYACTVLPDHVLHSNGVQTLIADQSRTEYAGPLAGIEAGLSECRTAYMATAPCDSPFLPLDLVEKLSTALLRQQADIAVAICKEMQPDGSFVKRSHPVFSLMKTSVLESLRAYLHANGRKVRTWQATLKVAEVIFDEQEAFYNINTLQELHHYEA